MLVPFTIRLITTQVSAWKRNFCCAIHRVYRYYEQGLNGSGRPLTDQRRVWLQVKIITTYGIVLPRVKSMVVRR